MLSSEQACKPDFGLFTSTTAWLEAQFAAQWCVHRPNVPRGAVLLPEITSNFQLIEGQEHLHQRKSGPGSSELGEKSGGQQERWLAGRLFLTLWQQLSSSWRLTLLPKGDDLVSASAAKSLSSVYYLNGRTGKKCHTEQILKHRHVDPEVCCKVRQFLIMKGPSDSLCQQKEDASLSQQ